MIKYNLADFIEGFNRMNACKFEDLTYSEVKMLVVEYEHIDPLIAQCILEAYIQSVPSPCPAHV